MLLMGKSTISMVIFNNYVKLPEGKMWGPTKIRLGMFYLLMFYCQNKNHHN